MSERSKKTKVRILVGLAIAFALSLLLRIHIVRTGSRGELFWNTEDAYVFISIGDVGYNFSYLGYVVEVVREIYPLGASGGQYSDCSLLVLHVTPNSIQQYTINSFCLAGIEPFHSILYSGNAMPGERFEPATSQDQDKLRLALLSGRIPPGPSYDHVEGWSKRTVAGEMIDKSPTVSVEKDSWVTIKVAGQNLTFIMNSGFLTLEPYIDLIRPGQPRQRIWHLDGRPHWVSTARYHRVFRDEIAKEVAQKIN